MVNFERYALLFVEYVLDKNYSVGIFFVVVESLHIMQTFNNNNTKYIKKT